MLAAAILFAIIAAFLGHRILTRIVLVELREQSLDHGADADCLTAALANDLESRNHNGSVTP